MKPDTRTTDQRSAPPTSDVAFTPTVKAIQARKGSRAAYRKMEDAGGFSTEVTEDLRGFIADRDSFYLGTASKDGQPYIQHRGGPPGFLHVLDEHTLAFADLRGNRQYISTGNLHDNARAFIFLMDYANRQRIKIWGEARVVDDDPALLARVTHEGYRGRPEQVIVFRVTAWDANCPQHIPQKIDAADVQAALAERDTRIAALEAELARLRQPAGESPTEPSADPSRK